MKHRKFLWILILLVLMVATLFCGCQASNTYIIEDSFISNEKSGSKQSYDIPWSYAVGKAAPLAVIPPNHTITDNSDIIESQAALLVNTATAEVILSKCALLRMYPASTTKIMTALLALEYGDTTATRAAGEEVRIKEVNAVLCDYRVGDEISFDIAIHGTMLPSGNDAAAFLSTFVEEDTDRFVQLMNDKATELGATKSNFKTVHGLHDPGHYTTAYDLYLIFNEALKIKAFRRVIHTTTYQNTFTRSTATNTYRIVADYKTTNRFLLGEYAFPKDITIIGGKSGYTTESGYNYVMGFTYEDQNYIMVVLGANDKNALYSDMQKMMQLVSNADMDYITNKSNTESEQETTTVATEYSDHN